MWGRTRAASDLPATDVAESHLVFFSPVGPAAYYNYRHEVDEELIRGHIASPTFGYDIQSQTEPTALDRIWFEASFDHPLEAQLVLQEAYETVYQLYDHDTDSYDHPLALVSLHPKEDPATYSRLYGELARFAHEELIRDLWGLSVIDLLNMPKDVVDEIYRLTRQITADRGEEGESVSRKLMRQTQKGARL